MASQVFPLRLLVKDGEDLRQPFDLALSLNLVFLKGCRQLVVLCCLGHFWQRRQNLFSAK
jgi:hypothetical protein